MNRWWGNFVKDYLTFSKKERHGIFFILLFSVAAYSIARLLPIHKKPEIGKNAFQKELAQLQILVDTAHNSYSSQHEEAFTDYNRPANTYYASNKIEVFAFDPNTLDAAGWRRLGIKDKTINTIHNFLAKGYRFRQPNDIRKIYGLRSADADRLVAYVRILQPETNDQKALNYINYTPSATKSKALTARISTIEINTADTAQLIALPGIGSKLAARIINFRDKLGGFNSVTQLAETYGLPDSTFQKIKDRLQCSNSTIKKININTADANQLKGHPYIKWNLANAIVNFRNQHGDFNSLDDLKKIEILTDDVFNKIAPYLTL